ncbi:outer membrane protein [Helicobacter mustelae]|uniref:META domain-containing protein n=1 Tax=Helicobacter mustelae TaxID=217 RepID=UPI000DFBEE4B|nr:META domain-containing protein [Helicobacter mustelae]STP11985.1 outer membrane protein [Helicobacter mustelae]
MRVALWLLAMLGILQATSVSQALVDNKFLGKWQIVAVDVDGSRVYVPYTDSFVEFQSGQYIGFVGCNNFFGKYAIMEQRHLVLVMGGATKEMCGPVVGRFETTFLRYFYGDFLLKFTQGFLILKSDRMQVWLIRY